MKKNIIILMLFVSAVSIFSDNSLPSLKSYVSFLSDSEYNELLSQGELITTYSSEFIPKHVPDTDLKNSTLDVYKNAEIGLGLEGLYLHKYPNGMDVSNMTQDEILLKSYNIFNSVTSMQGIEYYSVGSKKYKVLFERSFAVKGVKDKKPIADESFKAIPPFRELFALQDDSTFGENIYKAEYMYKNSAVSMNIVNETDMKLLFIKLLSKGTMHINLSVTPTKEGLLFYGASGTKTINIKAVKESATESLLNRVVALNNWFKTQFTDSFSN